jgi:hypothetical protein
MVDGVSNETGYSSFIPKPCLAWRRSSGVEDAQHHRTVAGRHGRFRRRVAEVEGEAELRDVEGTGMPVRRAFPARAAVMEGKDSEPVRPFAEGQDMPLHRFVQARPQLERLELRDPLRSVRPLDGPDADQLRTVGVAGGGDAKTARTVGNPYVSGHDQHATIGVRPSATPFYWVQAAEIEQHLEVPQPKLVRLLPPLLLVQRQAAMLFDGERLPLRRWSWSASGGDPPASECYSRGGGLAEARSGLSTRWATSAPQPTLAR